MKITMITAAQLFVAFVVIMATMMFSPGSFSWNIWILWTIAPYIVLGMLFCLPPSQSRARAIAGCVSSALVLVFTCLWYIDAMWISYTAYSPLIFGLAPFYLFAGAPIVWGVIWFVLALRQVARSQQKQSS